MYIEESTEELENLLKLCDDKNKKIKILANYIAKIVRAIDSEDDYQMEQNERKG